ncbi:unnamed protein product [Discula destructiva]
MALVDYSSSDSDAADHAIEQPPAKMRKTSAAAAAAAATTAVSTTTPSPPISNPSPVSSNTQNANTPLPPLPAAFHNLYATTVRPSPADQPALHQGRRRVIPHIEGNWPSHIFVEWHPSPTTHTALACLLDALAHDELRSLPELTSSLTSDLHAPLPLHISLSRPFVLRTEQKDAFLEDMLLRGRDIAGAAGAGAGFGATPFELCADGLAWFRSKEGGRSFLVLRVRSSSAQPAQQGNGAKKKTKKNPELAALLARCNELVGAYGQPRLYAVRSLGGEKAGGHADGLNGDGGGGDYDDDGGVQSVEGEDGVDDAFHVSIAWSFAEPTREIRERTATIFAREQFRRGIMDGIRIPVNDVKVKIGNVVTSIPLPGKRRQSSGGGKGLFGI